MIPVPAGRVVLDDGRRRRVRPFQLDRRPVTNAEFRAFIEATRGDAPQWMFRPGFDDPDQPVVGVTYAQARAYARWAGKRLPREREWIRAARGEDDRTYPWGDAGPDLSRAHFGLRSGRPAPAGRAAGAAPFGHLDLVGNVWEWCEEGVLRGGFWGAPDVPVTARLAERPDRVAAGIGFRCAR